MTSPSTTALVRHDRRSKHQPERTCALTRIAAHPDVLIRFTTDPGGTVVPDIANKLPGRGVWLGCRRHVVEAAIARKAFDRGFKTAVTVPDDFVDRLDELLKRAALQSLSIANKAGLVVAGQGKVDAMIGAVAAFALLQAGDAAPGGREKMARRFRAISAAHDLQAPTIEHFSVDELSLALGRANVVHAALAEGHAASIFVWASERLERFRSDAPFDPGAEIPRDVVDLAPVLTARVAGRETGIE